MATITLTTPTGNIGSKVLRRLIEEAPEWIGLRVIARDPSRLPENTVRRIEVVQGDTRDEAVLHSALQGAAALFWCQPDTPDAPDYTKAYEDWSERARAAIDAAGVSRVVAIASAGVAPMRPAGPLTALHRLEAIIGTSTASCRFLRCGSFFSNVLWQWDSIVRDGVFSYSMPRDSAGPHVAPDDVAAVAARWLLDEGWTGNEAISLPGPADMTYDEMAAALSRHLNRSVRYDVMSAEAYVSAMLSMGLSASAAQGMVDMFDHLATDYRLDGPVDRALTPTTFEQWLRRHVSP